MRQPRFLLYAVDGLGLGHVTRLLGLARAIRRQSSSAEILFLTASEASHVIYREGFAAVKVPSRSAASTGKLRHASWLRLTQTMVWNAVAAFDPHCLVVDSFAAGSLHELLPLLRWPLRKVFVFRAQRSERALDPFTQSTLRLYDLILVPHTAGTEDVPTPPSVKTIWTGPMLLRDPADLQDRDTARAALGLPRDGTIGLITLGGGGEPEMVAARAQLHQAILAANNAGGSQVYWVEMDGPLSRDASSEYSTESSQYHVLRDVHPLMIYLRAFDFAVSAAGYNTTHELQAAQVPTVLWPFSRDLDDQAQRARRLAQAGRALCIGEGTGMSGEKSDNRVAELSAAISDVMRPATREKLRIAMSAGDGSAEGAEWHNGATTGAAAMLELLA
jgi:UDP-N-acetylglucosamine--N-acetylmuramyl-(pentapeptide) pyrophosphoryl-undecaprenol N-acetylglucosamine transferase